MSAPLAKRLSATAFDLALFGIPYLAAVSSAPPEPVRVAGAFAAPAALVLQTLRLAREGRSFGKRRAGLRVVSFASGEPVSVPRALARAAAGWGPNLLLALCGALPAWLALDALVLWRRADGRSLTDLIAGTAVEESAS